LRSKHLNRQGAAGAHVGQLSINHLGESLAMSHRFFKTS